MSSFGVDPDELDALVGVLGGILERIPDPRSLPSDFSSVALGDMEGALDAFSLACRGAVEALQGNLNSAAQAVAYAAETYRAADTSIGAAVPGPADAPTAIPPAQAH